MTSRDTRDIIGGVLLMATGVFFALHSGNYTMGEAARWSLLWFSLAFVFVAILLSLIHISEPTKEATVVMNSATPPLPCLDIG